MQLDQLYIHHIFLKDFLEKSELRDLWDDVANITVISRRANESIGNGKPEEYLKELYEKDSELLEEHFIPLDKKLWKIRNYDKFLKERRALIAKAIEEKLGIKVLR